MEDMNEGCWVLDGVKLSEPTCHGCYVTRSEESVLAGKPISGVDFYTPYSIREGLNFTTKSKVKEDLLI